MHALIIMCTVHILCVQCINYYVLKITSTLAMSLVMPVEATVEAHVEAHVENDNNDDVTKTKDAEDTEDTEDTEAESEAKDDDDEVDVDVADATAKAKAVAVARLAEFDKQHMAPMQRKRNLLKKVVHTSHGRRWPPTDIIRMITLFQQSKAKTQKDEIMALAAAFDRSEKACKIEIDKIIKSIFVKIPKVTQAISEFAISLGKTEACVMSFLALSHGGKTLDCMPTVQELLASLSCRDGTQPCVTE